MLKKLSLKYRLILPIALLGIVVLLSNALAVSNIKNVNANAASIADNYMAEQKELAQIRQSTMNLHKMALSHIVATDYETMITLVSQIKSEEEILDQMLAEYGSGVTQRDQETYEALLSNYDSFKHALVFLVCASADGKTQDAYGYANGDVASFGSAMEDNINTLNNTIDAQTDTAREQLSSVYLSSMVASCIVIGVCVILIFSVLTIIMKSVLRPIKSILNTIKGSSERINDVVGEVLKRTKTSNVSTMNLSALAEELSATIQEVANNAANINHNTEGTRGYVNEIAEECNAINNYSVEMNMRAEKMEQSAQMSMEAADRKVSEIMEILDSAIKESRSVDQVNNLTNDILNIAETTNLIALNASLEATRAGSAGKGFAMVAKEIRKLADSSSETASRIQNINEGVIDAVHHLSDIAQSMAEYVNNSILKEFQNFVQSGNQYKEDAAYIKYTMDEFNEKTAYLRRSMAEIVESISSITSAIDDGADGIARVAESTQNLVEDMSDITQRMDVNHETVGQLKKEATVFANL